MRQLPHGQWPRRAAQALERQVVLAKPDGTEDKQAVLFRIQSSLAGWAVVLAAGSTRADQVGTILPTMRSGCSRG